jgi:hypothetical protein
MVHPMSSHYLIFDTLFEEKHALVKRLNFKGEQIFNLVSFIVNPLQLQIWNFNVLGFEERRV